MHAHGTRTRSVVGEPTIEIRRYLCTGCGAASLTILLNLALPGLRMM